MNPPFLAYDYENDKHPFLFASYAHSDADIVYPILQKLHETGVRIWYDEGIPVSEEWLKKIADSINHCSSFLVFLSKSSITRNNVKREIYYALKRYDKQGLQVIPIHLEEISLPEDLELSLGPIQALMKYKLSENLFLEKLVGKLDTTIFYNSLSTITPIKNPLPPPLIQPKKEVIEDGTNALSDYHGQKLIKYEYDVITEIEKKTGAIPFTWEIKYDTFGIKIENNHVTGLGLYQKGLTSLPESIGNLTSLQELRLYSNMLTSLPESIGNLTSLIKLGLGLNKLTSLPETIGNLKSLKELYLYKNQLTSLPETIGNLSLQTLDLSWNNLTSLPETITNLNLLSIFHFQGNTLRKLSNNTDEWLKQLEKNGCNIKQ